jgi:hypothetical protein
MGVSRFRIIILAGEVGIDWGVYKKLLVYLLLWIFLHKQI